MLSTSTSSVQTRRRTRQASAAGVPQLATNLPGSTSPTTLAKQQSTTLSPTFGRLSTDDQDQSLDTNIGQFSQHIMQGAQQHSAAQPGYRYVVQHPQMDSRINPQMIQMMQEQAARQAMNNMQQAQLFANQQAFASYTQGNSPMLGGSPVADSMPVTSMPMTTPVLVQRAGTPPTGFLPSPPPTQKTNGRVVRHIVDTAPMPIQFDQIPVLQQPMMADMALFPDMTGQSGNTSPYQSSLADPHSPHLSPDRKAPLQAMQMPTLFPDTAMMPHHAMLMQQQQQQHQHQIMMAQAAAGARFYYPDSPMHAPLSPREAMLAGLEADASIEETGISAEEVASYISSQDPNDSRWTCLFPECGKKFGRKENIRSHVQTHLGDRQFKCKHCGKCFVRQHDLKRHAKIHSGDKPHKCPCGNGFARQDALTRHRQRGVCSGALPGFERREVKRGRPRKHRPELEDRLDKALRSRQLDARRGSDDDAYSSSSQSESGESDPYTPPHLSDADQFGDLSTDAGVDAFIKAYQNTPPTSPLTKEDNVASAQQNGVIDAYQNFAATGHELSAQHFSPRLEAERLSPTAVSPKQLHSPNASPVLLQMQATPMLSGSTQTAQTSPALTTTSTAAPSATSASQAEPSFADNLFDWAVIEAQPGLMTDSFSPAAASSPTHTDLFGDDLDIFAVPRNEMFGQFGKAMGADMVADGANFFDFTASATDVEGWLLGH